VRGGAARAVAAALSVAAALLAAPAVSSAETPGTPGDPERGEGTATTLRPVVHAVAAPRDGLIFQQGPYLVAWRPGSHRAPYRLARASAQASELLDAVAASNGRVYWLTWGPKGYRGPVDVDSADMATHRVRVTVRHADTFQYLTANSSHLFWIDGTHLSRSTLFGHNVLHRYLRLPKENEYDVADGLAVDTRYVYVSQCGNGRIGRVALSQYGDHPHIDWVVRGLGDSCPQSIAVGGGWIFWAGGTKGWYGTIGRARLDGTRVDPGWVKVSRSLWNSPYAVTVLGGHVYWLWGDEDDTQRSWLGGVSVGGSGLDERMRRVDNGALTSYVR